MVRSQERKREGDGQKTRERRGKLEMMVRQREHETRESQKSEMSR